MGIAFDGEELIWVMIYDARDKHAFENGLIVFNRDKIAQVTDGLDEVIEWIDKILEKEKVVQYKFLGGNKIEIKEYFFSPSKEICENVISFMLKTIDLYGADESTLFKYGCNLYTRKELVSVVYFAIKRGFVYVDVQKPWDASKYEYLKNIKVYELRMQQLDIHSTMREGSVKIERV
ncbi:TPA: hypothetical protein DEO28_01535 [Candidatus Dependentiae bacterium]|nr:MAG: hypothetical protein UR14_C0003G0154 [candidate division TM6 bacterium GW2011_GWE2_31_21]KKP53682.1 MAG: hypothetical protein UR43_C0003G0003 [candidate division TM6 bacterium GW2011_GWF2_33_332]HBS48566.1 hypothetical protein [Candidatus Dependentiae bacterium]HBZ73181.1 hypothetical protein [Candidatus Dependentiae bacterium]